MLDEGMPQWIVVFPNAGGKVTPGTADLLYRARFVSFVSLR